MALQDKMMVRGNISTTNWNLPLLVPLSIYENYVRACIISLEPRLNIFMKQLFGRDRLVTF